MDHRESKKNPVDPVMDPVMDHRESKKKAQTALRALSELQGSATLLLLQPHIWLSSHLLSGLLQQMHPQPIHMLPLLLPAACIHAAPKQSQTHPAAALAAAACKCIHLMQSLLLLHANMLSNLHTASMLPWHLLLHTEHLFLRDLRLSSHMLLLHS